MQVFIRSQIFSTELIHKEANNLDIGLNIADDLEQLRSNLDKFKKAGMGGDLDIDIEQMDWVENNRKVKAFFIYETSVQSFIIV